MDDERGPIVTVFRSRLRAEAVAEYERLAADMEKRARAMTGLVDFKTFTADDGERVSIVVFDTWGHHRAWRHDDAHRAAQRRGREAIYAEYSIRVCQEIRYRYQHQL